MSQENKIPFFRNFSPAMNFMSVFSLIFLGYILAWFFIFFIARSFWGLNIFENENALSNINNPSILALHRLMMIIITIFVFITPSTIFRRYMEFDGQDYLVVRKKPSIKIIGIIVLLFLFCFPASNFLFYINNLVDMGEAIINAEAQDAKFTQAILYTDSFSTYIINLFAIALLTAIGEELLFRGIFQRLFLKIVPNIHLAIFFGAILFSMMHFSYAGFLPRLFMGMVLGYIYLTTANIWYCILFHFLNNALAITFAWLITKGYDLSFYDLFGSMSFDRWIGLSLLLILITYGIFQLKKLVNNEFIDDIKEF